jgi:hypothetical protein
MLAAIDGTTTEMIRSRPPLLHGDGGHYFGLAWKALEWIEANVQPGMRTLETGAGASTVVFAARGALHTAISYLPLPQRVVAGLRVRLLDRGPLAGLVKKRIERRSRSAT